MTSFVGRLKSGLARTRAFLGTPISEIVRGGRGLDEACLELEAALVRADVGPELSARIVRDLRAEAQARGAGADLGDLLRRQLLEVLGPPAPVAEAVAGPRVVFFVGVNGTGKTTTIGKHAAQLRAAGARPLLAACDTFRAAAIEQLSLWATRAGAPIVAQSPGADPAAVLHDALSRAKERGESPVLVDTAGRLHVKTHLMDELAKMSRVAARLVPGAPHDCWLVIDATTGQNGLAQAREFGRAIPLTGLVLTKLDGTAKGGIALAITKELGVPLRWVGVGEQVDDLVPFDAQAYVDGLLAGEPAAP